MLHQKVIICLILLTIFNDSESSWGVPGSGQYHIQTDEGPERYFRFQTDNGQFRKEKRLQDGTVIGTEAWIDAAGMLRQTDYIADKQGYRILKAKTIFVGQGRQIEDAIKSTKSAPAQSGILVDGRQGFNSITNTNANIQLDEKGKQQGYVYSTTPLPTVATSTPSTKLNYLSPAEAAKLEPSTYLGFDHYPDELQRLEAYSRQPLVHIRPNAEPIDQQSNSINDYLEQRPQSFATPVAPSILMEPPPRQSNRRFRPSALPQPIAGYEAIRSSTTAPTAYISSTPAPLTTFASTTAAPSGYNYGTSTPADVTDNTLENFATKTQAAPTQDLNLGLLPPVATTHRRLRPLASLAGSYNPTFEEYNGVGTTQNGFRYILPSHYHEEEQIDEQKRAGSYGYIDPFGIRRVVYYNASPQRGFVHRNNNRYVGLNVGATPYDPPPAVPALI